MLQSDTVTMTISSFSRRLFLHRAATLPTNPAVLWLEPAASGVNQRFSWEDSGGGNNLRFWLPSEDPARLTA